MVTKIGDDLNKSSRKSYKKKIQNIFKFGSNSDKSEQNIKTKSKSLRSKLKSFWKRQNSESKDECKWLLAQSSSQIYSGINGSESDTKEKNICKNKVKEAKEKSTKNKSLAKKVGKITLQTCRYMSLGSAHGYVFNPTAYYNYETNSYDYQSYGYSDSQSYSVSMFF